MCEAIILTIIIITTTITKNFERVKDSSAPEHRPRISDYERYQSRIINMIAIIEATDYTDSCERYGYLLIHGFSFAYSENNYN